MDLLAGGFEFDGAQEISPLDEEKVRSSISRFLQQGFRSFVIAGSGTCNWQPHAEVYSATYDRDPSMQGKLASQRKP